MKLQAPISPDQPLLDRAEQFVPEAWNRVKAAYTTYRRGVWETRLRYANQQWLDWDVARHMFRREVPNDPWVPMPNINRIGPWLDGIASNFQSVPEIEAIPVPLDDPVSMGIADVVNKLCDHAIKDNALRSDYGSREDRSNMARQIFTMAGCVFSRVRLENNEIGQRDIEGQDKPTYSMQCLACGQMYPDLPVSPQSCPSCGSTQMTVEEGKAGNPMTEAVTRPRVIVDIEDPVWFSPRPGSRSMDDTEWLFSSRRLSVDEVERRTGIEATPDGEYPDGFNTSYQNELIYWYLGYATPMEANADSCLFVEFWCEPGKKPEFPEGCYACYFNGKVQQAVPWSDQGPVDHPITKGDAQVLPGIFFPRAVSFDLCEIQAQLTRYDSIVELHMKTNAVEPVVVDENTKVSEITGRADKIVYWRSIGPGSKEPHRMAHGNLDPKLFEQIKYLEQKGESIAATVSVFRGEQPGSITAASAIAQLRGQAEQQFAVNVKNYNNFWKETVRKCVLFYQKYPLDELVSIVGDNLISQINDFINADLKKCLEFIATSNGLPRTRDERRQEMMVLYDKGALDINDPQVRQKLFELFGDTGMMDNFNEDATRARSNIRMIKDRGMSKPFRPGIDDPNIHLSLALSAAKQMDFDQWPPQAQQALLVYIQSVQQVVAQQQPVDPNVAKAGLMKQMADDKNETALDIAVINASIKEPIDQLTAQVQALKTFSDILISHQQAAAQPPPNQAPPAQPAAGQ